MVRAGDVIRLESAAYTLSVDPIHIDALRFEDIVRASDGETSDPGDAAVALRGALAMWRGHPYVDVERMAASNPRSLDSTSSVWRRLEARVDADLGSGRHRELIAELESLTVEHPLRERFRAQHMLALYRSGRQAEALRAYERTRTYLVDELGIDPSTELRHLEQQILEQDPAISFGPRPSIRRRRSWSPTSPMPRPWLVSVRRSATRRSECRATSSTTPL